MDKEHTKKHERHIRKMEKMDKEHTKRHERHIRKMEEINNRIYEQLVVSL